VISGLTTRGDRTFSQVLNGIEVNLYKKICDTWTLVSPSTSSDNGGHYKFTIATSESGIYKVEPVQSGYTFYPEYNNVEITIPQSSPHSYDFTGNQ
jgi:hypothetical protein